MRYNTGDRVKVCGVIGNILNVHKDTRIGFRIFHRNDTYDVVLSHVPSSDIELIQRSTDFSQQAEESFAVQTFGVSKVEVGGTEDGTD